MKEYHHERNHLKLNQSDSSDQNKSNEYNSQEHNDKDDYKESSGEHNNADLFRKIEKKSTQIDINQNKEEEQDIFYNYQCISMPSWLRHIDIIRERKLSVQVGVVYTLFMIIFIIAIGITKVIQINSLFETQTKKNYYNSIVNDMIGIQREIKVQTDEVNNNEHISSLFSSVLFLRIFTSELTRHGIQNGTVFTIPNNINDSIQNYAHINQGFTLNKSLFALMDIDKDSNQNFGNLYPFLYLFIPLIYQNLRVQGIPIENTYFLNYALNENKWCSDTFKKNYFKYPLEKSTTPTEARPTNDYPFDYVLDPIGVCWKNNITNGEESIDNSGISLKEDIANSNWYYHFEQSESFDSYKPKLTMHTLLKVIRDNQKREYFINYYPFTMDYNGNTLHILICFKISRTEMSWPYITLGSDGDVLHFSYFSILNFVDAPPIIKIEKDENSFRHYNYNIDDGLNKIINLPKFIDNMYKYSMKQTEVIESQQKGQNSFVNENAQILKYSMMDNLKSKYQMNYYYKHDISFYKLVVFLNKFLNYYNKNDFSKEIEESDDPCKMDNIEEYYDEISKHIDCLEDYCFYNECTMADILYIKPEQLNFMPNCYCIPFYCRNKFSNTSFSFHRDIINKLNLNENSYSYSFTYISNEDNTSISDYINSNVGKYNYHNNEFKCQIKFVQKNKSENDTFDVLIKLQNISIDSSANMFLMFLMSNNEINTLIVKFQNLVEKQKFIIYGVYFFCLILAAIFLIWYLVSGVEKFTERIREMREIRKQIISPQSEEKKKESETNSNAKSNECINGKDNDALVNDKTPMVESSTSKDSDNKVVKEETDELTTLRDLIKNNESDFFIDFNINGNLNSNILNIEKQYNEIIKVNEYKKMLLPSIREEENDNNLIDEFISMKNENINNSSTTEKRSDVKEAKKIDLSLNIYYELISLKTDEVDFCKTKTNFYYRDHLHHSILDLDEYIKNWKDDGSSNPNEITTKEKIENTVDYYQKKIHSYWKLQYDLQKEREEI